MATRAAVPHRPDQIARVALAAALIVAAASCKHDSAAPEPFDPVDDLTATETARRYIATLEECEPAALRRLIDMEQITLRGTAGIDASAAAKRAFARGTAEGATMELMCQRAADASFRLLRIVQRGRERRALIRILHQDGSVDYHELLIGKSRKDGRVAIRDVYTMMSGQSLSESTGEMFVQLVPHAGTDRIDREIAAMKTVRERLAAGDGPGALAGLEALSPELQSTRPVLLLRVTIASDLDDATYLDAIERYQRAFPDDASMNLVAIDGHIMREDWDAALRSVGVVDRYLGGDPFLDSVRAVLLVERGDRAEALAAARRLVEAEPELEHGWQTLLVVQVGAGAYADAITTMEEVAARFDLEYDPDLLAEDPTFTDFIASEPYRRWRDRAGD